MGEGGEGFQPQIENEQSSELDRAQKIARRLLRVAVERSERPESRVRRYSMPMLERNKFPSEMVDAVVHADGVTEQKVAEARQATVAMSFEAAMQVLEARPDRGGQVAEDGRSLGDLAFTLREAEDYVAEQGQKRPEEVVAVMREVGKRRGDSKLRESSDEWVLGETNRVMRQAWNRVKQIEGRLRDAARY